MKFAIQDSFKQMISYDTKDDNEMRTRVEHNIKALENNNMETLNDALNNVGCTFEDEEKVMLANVWVAIADEAQLKVDQQRTLNKCCYHVRGSRLTEPESKRREVSYFY